MIMRAMLTTVLAILTAVVAVVVPAAVRPMKREIIVLSTAAVLLANKRSPQVLHQLCPTPPARVVSLANPQCETSQSRKCVNWGASRSTRGRGGAQTTTTSTSAISSKISNNKVSNALNYLYFCLASDTLLLIHSCI